MVKKNNPSDWQILIVEDEFDSLAVLTQTLEHNGVRVHSAGDGRECLNVLRRVQPTLVIMDLQLPEMDGWQALAAIRADPKTTNLPVVAITAYHSASVAEDAVNAGFNAYFPKPLDLASFVSSLAAIITRS